MLRENGASLYIFPQHSDEIADILRNFRDRDACSTKVTQPLERLETDHLTSIEIDREIRSLAANLKELNITIASRESYVDRTGVLKTA